MKNITNHIINKIGRGLYKDPQHPICIVKDKVSEYFDDLSRIEIENPYVPVEYNFDRLRVPKDHPSRRLTDTYYQDAETCLRTHMTCYLYPLGKSETGKSKLKYITTGDVYRKDAIDSTHYPVFHQMDAFCIVDDGVDVKQDLRNRLTGLVKHLFGDNTKYKFLEESLNKDIHFPFTIDSLEVEVFLKIDGQEKNLEILGAGTVHPDIMKDLGLPNKKAWAFGLGLDRLAMILFGIPDIRLFWSQDPRFLNQFKAGQITKFVPYSKYQSCWKDISFYINDSFSYNDMCSLIRDQENSNLIESIKLIDEFVHKGKTSQCYRITYSPMEKPLRGAEINKLHKSIAKKIVDELKVELR